MSGKTSLINEIISNFENKEKILFISRMDELRKKNRGINHIVADGDKYSRIDYEMIEKQGYETVFIDDAESFEIDEKGKINFVFSLDRGRKEDIKSVTHFFDELNQKQYKKKVIDVVAVASIDSKMKHSFKILEL